MNEIARQIREAVDALVTLSHLQAGALVVLGCSTSEMVGGRIGQNAQPILGRVVAQAAIDACAAHGVELAVQCCEHLNRALVMERATLVRRGFRQVMAVPMPHAGGSCGAAAYRLMRDPVLAEHVEADAGLDIGDTMIGMHLRHVAVPLRAKIRRIGAANLVLAGTRPPYIGGPRAKYERNREEETMNAKFALQLYSVREAYAADLEGTLRQVAEMGYTGVEGFGDFTYPAARIKAALEANHLVLVGWHTGLAQWEDERFDQTVAYFQALHNTRAVVPWADPDVYATRTDAMSFAERLNALSKRLAPYGICTGYHNHGGEFVPMADGVTPWEVIMDHTDDAVIAQLDNGNALSSGNVALDVCAMVKGWPGRAKTVHLKPYARATQYDTMVGEDDINWRAFMQDAIQVGGAEWLIVEYECKARYGEMEAVACCLHALEAIAKA